MVDSTAVLAFNQATEIFSTDTSSPHHSLPNQHQDVILPCTERVLLSARLCPCISSCWTSEVSTAVIHQLEIVHHNSLKESMHADAAQPVNMANTSSASIDAASCLRFYLNRHFESTSASLSYTPAALRYTRIHISTERALTQMSAC